eukprot:TRINITY_DN9968_c0_g1_i18.p1 TRINITY_DN9968_c0_g1~~TRINITY_DN9968_c0_g1_i18.p1  ORF type:complete len:219 (+),score=41.19 TRINITY_DN9968_c0_g1_i18:71-727(+)
MCIRDSPKTPKPLKTTQRVQQIHVYPMIVINTQFKQFIAVCCNSDIMPDYDAGALLCLGVVVTFSFLINVSEIFYVFREIQGCFSYRGLHFDCSYYPLISRLILIICTALISFVCVLSTAFLLCFESSTVLEHFVLYSLYAIFGPIMAGVSFFFLLNYEQYGYTCDRRLNKIYNPAVWVVLNFMCVIGIILSIVVCAKAFIKRIELSLIHISEPTRPY